LSAVMNDSFLDQMQQEIVAILKSDEVLGTLPILDERIGDIQKEVDKALGLVKDVDGKIGACVIVQQAIAEDNMVAAAGGILETSWTLLVLEEPVLNDGASGHQIRALTIARRIVRVLKLYRADGLCTSLVPSKKAIMGAAIEGVSLSYAVVFHCTEIGQGVNQKVVTPTLAPNGGVAPQTVTITCGTAGAVIYYTLDGTCPWSGNGVLYAGPVAVAAAGTIRARAFKAGMVGSNAAAADFT
jgi:hypothetical protein